ncbi:hypothetical protein [Flavicella sediminum]|uniref:hypothetical protein n=1 Tax=Flavicella sediminum TaxID=2585141 RepID=UPI00140DEA3A|nr:hypothetical protein [Flavicella sediminum]
MSVASSFYIENENSVLEMLLKSRFGACAELDSVSIQQWKKKMKELNAILYQGKKNTCH